MSKKSKPTARPEGAEARRPSRWKRRAVDVAVVIPLAGVLVVVATRRITGERGMAFVADDECAVIVDHWSGAKRLVSSPGPLPYMPWLQEVHPFDKSPNAFVMSGNKQVSHDHVPRLLVRANDGSSLWFESIVIQYALIADRAPLVLEDTGGGDAFKEKLMRAHARSILRDEFGRFSAEDVGRPENVRAATRASLERLNGALEPHGIAVLEISTPKPTFDKNYEDQIGRRGGSIQEVEHLRAQLTGLANERIRREEAVRTDKELERRKLDANLVRDIGAAERELIRAKAEADNVYREKVAAADAAKFERESQAQVLATKYRGLADEARKRAELLVRDGPRAVRAALVDKLAQIEFQLVPYSRDAAPRRIEHEDAQAALVPAAKAALARGGGR